MRLFSRPLSSLYLVGAVERTKKIWVLMQLVLWFFFAIGYLADPSAWIDVQTVDPSSAAVGGWLTTFGYILARNAVVLALISIGNLFVRFGSVTPGLFVLVIQGATIGWVAGTNGFEVPFTSMTAANVQFLRVGLWETTAYAIICALTLTKSLLVASSFPAKEWTEVYSLKELRFSKAEKVLGLLATLSLVVAALVEALYLTR